MITGNGLPWWSDRKKCFNWYLSQLKVGDSIVSSDAKWQVVYLFLNSKVPQYIVYHLNVPVFPLDHQATPKKSEVINFLMNQDSASEDNYFDHTRLTLIENGCIDLMTDISDLHFGSARNTDSDFSGLAHLQNTQTSVQ